MVKIKHGLIHNDDSNQEYLDENFIFSIIVNFNNSERVLEECINSILNQTLGFEENIQLILINNHCDDNSLNIALKYQELYPNNILVLENTFKNRSSGWNKGLSYAKGKYINFLDVMDYLSENTLKNVYSFFEISYKYVDVVSIPIYIFNNHESGQEHELNYKFNRPKIIDLKYNPKNIQVSIYSSFIKSSSIRNKKFRTDLIYNEDTLFLTEIIMDKLKYGVIPNARYYYRESDVKLRLFDDVFYNKMYYTSRLDLFYFNLIEKSINEYGVVLKYLQYLFINDLLNIFKLSELNIFHAPSFCQEIDEENNGHDENEEIRKFKDSLDNIISYIDNEVIMDGINNVLIKNFVLYLKNGFDIVCPSEEEVLLTANDCIIDNLCFHKLWINTLNITNNDLIIKGFLTSFFDKDDLILELYNEENNEIFAAELYVDNIHSKKILSHDFESRVIFKFNIPLNIIEEDYKFKIRWNINNVPNTFVYSDLGFYDDVENIEKNSIKCKGYRISLNEKVFRIEKIFKFSVVMAIYNTEKLLTEAIDSVINQSLNFEDNIQLILVDDGSEDNSLEICNDYKRRYPNNIIVISQENNGQAIARNNGLKYVHSEFVNFLDSDDYFSEETFENVYNFFKQHETETDIVSIPMKFFGRFVGDHQLNFKYDSNRVINLDDEPFNPQYHANSSFFNRDVLDEIQFPTDIVPSEDAMLINKILLKKRTLGVVKDAIYYYRKRFDMSSTLDLTNKEKVYFTDRLKKYYLGLFEYSKCTYGFVPKFLEYTLAQDLHWILFQPDLSFAKSQLELNEFHDYLDKVLDYISIETINNLAIDSEDLKSFYLYMKQGESHFSINNDENVVSLYVGNKQVDKINYHKIWLDIVEIKENFLLISGLYMGLISNDYLSIEAINELSNDNIESTFAVENFYPARGDRDYISQKWKYAFNFDLKIPIYSDLINNIKIRVNFHIDGDNTNFDEDNVKNIYLDIALQHYANISKYSNYIVKDSYILLFNNNSFIISPYSYKKMLKHEYHCIKKIFSDKLYYYKHLIVLRLLYLFLFPIMRKITKKRPIYLFMDRIDSAHDNGEVLWEYALSQKDNIKKYFIIDSSSSDYNRLSKIGKVIPFNSFRHKLIFLFADKIISSHAEEDVLNPFFSKQFDKDIRRFISGLVTLERFFIEHGVAQYNLSNWLAKYNMNIHYYLTSSNFETEGEFNTLSYPREIYHTLGMPRFDILENHPSKQILICPTWRFKLMGDSEGDKIRFLHSGYYQFLCGLLNNEKLIQMTKDYGCKLIFKPHPRLTHIVGDGDDTYVDLLNIDENIYVSYDESYTELLSNSSLMITDFSSVAFDFAYLEKPVIYYQADEIPHEEGYFDYGIMGFGDVIIDIDELITKIEYYIKNNFVNEDKYIERKRSFFKYHDKNNSKRVYESIK
ncbi:CDP-glycerol glycerophosphotransferase, TagB/SpsB family [Methanobrevibacter gottschalkii]|uniref:CDP-glycerol glycerophosphotransferase, TagB/SpsB family n=1 Tax=Methanobrevibacter gottschalkii TaxID=190974 RepID=A0A1H7MX94_9EURY|nr:glycosyltransferase [Methanobrevibacter gottschalkii]SEL15932.1 CDP-glycerol glycerophosphotransferase, TagB/SpsB family [Methanobrevibacter gottschalkii]